MGRKRIEVKYNGIPLYAHLAGREIRVTRDVKTKQNTTNYRLVDSTKPRYIFQSTELDLVKKHYDKYVADLSYKIDIPAIETTPTNKSEIKITWLHVFDNDEEILEHLFDFYGEKGYLESDQGEESPTIEQLAQDGECQTAITFMILQQARKKVEKNKNYEPFLYNLDKVSNQAYAFYNKKENQPKIIKGIADELNEHNSFINNQTKEELKEELFAASVVTKDNIKAGEEYWGNNLNVIDTVEDYYSDNIYKAKENQLIIAQRQITPKFIVDEFMKLLAKEPDTICKLSGVKEFGYIKSLLPKKTISLKQVGDYYFHREKYTAQRALERPWKRSMEGWWKEFLLITRATSLDDITLQTINDYQLEIHKVYNDNTYLPTWLAKQSKTLLEATPAKKNWVKKRFACVTAIFANLLKVVEDTTDTNRVLGYLKKLQVPSEEETYNPTPISRADFASLFKATEQITDEKMKVRWKCMLLLALNTASYFKDLSDIKKEQIDLHNKTLIMVRQKKKTLKVAKLWDITISHLKKLRQLNNNKSEFEITSSIGTKYSPITMRKYYSDILKPFTKVDAQFNSLRDGACYAMANGGISAEIRKMVMGHKTDKIQDRYLKRDGAIVSDAAEAIYDFYNIKRLSRKSV